MKTIPVLIILFIIPLYFYAWGKEGHMIVAGIAKTKLNKGIEEKIQKYLGPLTFEEASVWMDEIKSDHTYDFMKVWHYVNIEDNETYVKSADGDLISELNLVIKELNNYRNSDMEEVTTDLKILFHLCGDITQPLHAGYGSDKGGNDITLKYNTVNTNLHHIWDTDIITAGNITTESCLHVAEKLSEKEKKSYEKINIMQWMQDSRSLLFSVYNIKDKKIDDDYINLNKSIVENQLIKGGYRLAAVLNEIFKD